MSRALALLLLVVGLLTFYSWQWVPREHYGNVFALATHAYAAVLLVVLGAVLRNRLVWPVLLLLLTCSLLVMGCNGLYLIDPWPYAPDDDLCSAKLNWPIGALGLVMFLALCGGVYMDKQRGADHGP